MKHSLLALALAVCLFAAAGRVSAQATDPARGSLHLYRPSAIAARAYRPHIFLNREPLLDLRNGNVWIGQLAPGHYVLAAGDHDVFSDKDSNPDKVEFDIKGGETVYVRTSLRMGIRNPNTSLTIVPAEEGARESEKLREADPKDVKHPAYRQ